MENIKKYKWIIIIGLIIFGLYFYWYEWRPYTIRKFCGETATRESRIIKLYDEFYKRCMNIQGFER